ISSTGAAITLTGVGGGVGTTLYGVAVPGGTVQSGAGAISVTGTGLGGASGVLIMNFNGTGARIVSTSGDIVLKSMGGNISAGLAAGPADQISTAGNLTLDSVAGVAQNASATISAAGLRVLGSGAFSLNQSGNNISTLAASLTGGSLT